MIRVCELAGLSAAVFTLCLGVTASLCRADAPAALITAAATSGATISLTQSQQQALARLVTVNPDAHTLFAPLQATAQGALADTPHPIVLIQTEGKLPQDPLKVATQQSLHDMGRIEALGWTAAATGDPSSPANPYAAKAKEYILAWAAVNRSNGDPIDDTNLEPLFTTYDLVRATFTAEEQRQVERWLRQIADAEQHTGQGTRTTTYNNWNSHRLKVLGLIAFVLHDQRRITSVVDGYRRQVAVDLNPDGSSFDFHERDALHYHLYSLQPLLTLAIAARRNGVDLYDYHTAAGASLPTSLQFLIPYCDGSRTHAEFVGSRVSFDRKRAAAGDPHYQAGRLFDPHDALPTLARAYFFDMKYGLLEQTVSHQKTSRFVSWQDVLDEVERWDHASAKDPPRLT